MDWLKAWRWSSLRIHNNLIFVLPLTCITKVTPLLRHMHTSSANAQKDVFSCLHLAFAPFIHPLLPFLQHLSHSLHPIWGITRKYKNTTETFLLKKKKQETKQKQNMFPQIPHPTPLLGHVLLPCSSVPPPCLKRRKGEERVEGCNSSEHKVTVQKWTELNWGWLWWGV